LDGVLNVNKPAGWTSFDIVAFVRRHSGVKRVGHAGTLDPSAEGVLVVCLGQATRVLEYLLDVGKTYRARIHLGVATDTYDADGEVVRTSDTSSIGRNAVEQALDSLRGTISQKPPIYSALKREGTPLYKHARAGRNVEPEAREVHIYRLDLVDLDPPALTVEIDCGRGFYVRSFANDLGEKLGCGAHLEHLLRTRVGPFRLETAVGIDVLRGDFEDGTWADLVLPMDTVLLDWHAAILGGDNVENLRFGRSLDLAALQNKPATSLQAGTPCRAYSLEGKLIALLRYNGDAFWQPSKVLAGGIRNDF